MSSQQLSIPDRESSPPWPQMFHDHGVRRFNTLLRRGATTRSVNRRRSSQSQVGELVQASGPGTRRRPIPNRPRRIRNAQNPSTSNNSQVRPDGPPTHEGRAMPRLTEVSQNHASYGEYGRRVTSASAFGAGQSGLDEQLPGSPMTLALANTTSNFDLARENRHDFPFMTQSLGNHQLPSSPVQQYLYQSPIPPSTGTNLPLPTFAPARHQKDLTLTGPNQEPQHLFALCDQDSPMTLISAATALSLGVLPTFCAPRQQTYYGLAGTLTPKWFIRDILVESELFRISNLRVDLLVVPEIGGGFDIILGSGIFERMRQQSIISNSTPY